MNLLLKYIFVLSKFPSLQPLSPLCLSVCSAVTAVYYYYQYYATGIMGTHCSMTLALNAGPSEPITVSPRTERQSNTR